jgi:tetratricopeptide (TPR) repeat protein
MPGLDDMYIENAIIYCFGENAFNFIANLSEQPKTMEIHFLIAKTMSYLAQGSKMTIAEYQKAIQMAQEQGRDDMLQQIYLQQALSCFGNGVFPFVRSANKDEALKAIERYMKLDDSNARVLAYLGVVRAEMQNNKGAIEAFQKSLELNKKDYEVGITLLRTLFKMKDYEGMMLQIDHYGIPTVGSWLRESDKFDEHREILHAARAVNKVDRVLECYEREIQNIQLSDDDLNEVKDADPVKTAQQTLLRRKVRIAVSSMFRVYLGWLRLETLGQPDEAFELWKTSFFQRSEFFNLGNLASSRFTANIIPYFFVRFSQLIYEKALGPDPAVSDGMILHLEHLQRRKKVFQQLDKFSFAGANLRPVDLLLSKLYLKHGRKDEARKILNDQFQNAMDILEDDFFRNDRYGYDALATLLFLNGQLEKAELAMALKRFFVMEFDVESEDRKDDAPERAQESLDISDAERKDGESEVQERLPDKEDGDVSTILDNGYDSESNWYRIFCAGGYYCPYEPSPIPYHATVYTCTTCANMNFCQSCYDDLRKETNQRKMFVCSPKHDFIKTPPEGLEIIKVEGETDMLITLNGKTVSSVDWLADVRKEWKTGLCFKS